MNHNLDTNNPFEKLDDVADTSILPAEEGRIIGVLSGELGPDAHEESHYDNSPESDTSETSPQARQDSNIGKIAAQLFAMGNLADPITDETGSIDIGTYNKLHGSSPPRREPTSQIPHPSALSQSTPTDRMPFPRRNR